MENKCEWGALATAWELLAFSLRYPDQALIEAISSDEWAAAVSEVAACVAVAPPDASKLGSAAREDANAFAGELRVEATRLFIGAKEPLVSPYEGVWRAKDEGVQALLFVNPHSVEVERFCGLCGLGHPEGTNEPLDHVATECELLEYLASVEAGLFELPASEGASLLPGGSAKAAYTLFLTDHARVWFPRFADDLAQETRHPFYRFVARLLKAVAEAPVPEP